MFFCMGVSAFRKKFLIKDNMCRAENDISLYMAYKAVSIILVPNEYYQFGVWYEFVSQVSQEDLLRCSLLKMSNRHIIVYMSYSCYCEPPPGIWQTCFKLH